jgi:hypothetical protein
MLAARAPGTAGGDFKVVGVNLYINLFRFGQNRHRRGGGVYPALGFSVGHTLNPVRP